MPIKPAITRRETLAIGLAALLLPLRSMGNETTRSPSPDNINVRSFGAVADGKTDDSAAIERAIAAAKSMQINHIVFPTGNYLISRTIQIVSGITYEALGPVSISMPSGDSPVMRSEAFTTGGTRGNAAVIGRFSLRGNPQSQDNHGIHIHDFYTVIDGVSVFRCGGYGIYLSETNGKGTMPKGTLVENTVKNCTIRNCGMTSLKIGSKSNNKLTDGLVQNIIIQSTSTQPTIEILSAAGWTLQNIHLYGSPAPEYAIRVQNGYATTLENIYIENYQHSAISLERLQTSTVVNNIHIKSAGTKAEGAAVIQAFAERGARNPSVFMSNISINYEGKTPVNAMFIDDQVLRNIGPVLISGSQYKLVNTVPKSAPTLLP